MIGVEGFAALRLAATLTHSIPGLRARLRHGDRALVDVVPAGVAAAPDAVAVTPCGFRTAVVDAWRQERDGRGLVFWDLPAGEVPAIDIGVPVGGRSLPGGIHVVPAADREVWAFATTVDPVRCHDLVRAVVGDRDAPPGVRGLGMRGDAGTEVSIVYAELDRLRGRTCRDHVRDLIEELLACVSVDQLVSELATAPGAGGPGRSPGVV